MTPESVAAILTGLTSLVVAVGAILTNRTKRVQEDVDSMRNDVEYLQAQFKEAMKHIYALELLMINAGIEVPPRPDSLRLIKGRRDGAA